MISKQILNGVALFAFSLGLCLSPRSAAGDGTSRYWDIPSGGPGGPWNLVSPSWSINPVGGGQVPWTNINGINGLDAVFSASDLNATGNFTVTLAANVTVGD